MCSDNRVEKPRRQGYDLGWHDPRKPNEEPRRHPWFARLTLWAVS